MTKKKQLTTKELLASIKVSITGYLREWRYHADPSEQYTKKGPGRKHKQGKQKYIPAQTEKQFRISKLIVR